MNGYLTNNGFFQAVVCLILFVFVVSVSAQTKKQIVWTQTHSAGSATRGSVTFSPDGRFLASGRVNTFDVKIWNATDGTLIRTLNARDNDTNSLAFSPDSQYLATGTGESGQTLNLNLWHVSDGLRVVGRISAFTNGTIGVAFSPDGQYLAVCGFHARNYKIYHVPDMALVADVSNTDPATSIAPRVNAIAFSPDGQFIGIGDSRGVKLRRASDGSLIRSYGNGGMPINSIAFSPNGQYIAAAVQLQDSTYANCIDCTIKLWQVSDATLLHTYTNGTGMTFATIGFSPNGRAIAAGYADDMADSGAVKFWDVESEKTLRIDSQPLYFQGFAYSPNGLTYASLRSDGVVSVVYAP
ncbi:MAG TPA: cytochrome D1 domain-containing protein [Pyrinomonadaceae bacterium]|jgi:WD40 repeat protein